MARAVQQQGYDFFECERCGFYYKDAAGADECSRYDLEHGIRSAGITKKSIAPPDRPWQAVMKFIEEEQKAAKAKAAAAAKAKAAAEGGAAPSPAAKPAPAKPAAPAPAGDAAAKPKLTPEELEARKKAALEKAAAAKAAREASEKKEGA